jgi:hypothetical protein
LTKRVPSKVIADKVGLEKRAHLGVSGSGMVENEKMDFERSHVNEDREHYQTSDARSPVAELCSL